MLRVRPFPALKLNHLYAIENYGFRICDVFPLHALALPPPGDRCQTTEHRSALYGLWIGTMLDGSIHPLRAQTHGVPRDDRLLGAVMDSITNGIVLTALDFSRLDAHFSLC